MLKMQNFGGFFKRDQKWGGLAVHNFTSNYQSKFAKSKNGS
jgi:hypothetical protein